MEITGKLINAMLALSFFEYALVAIFLLFVVILRGLHKSDSSKFKFEDFFCDHTGKADAKELIAFGAFLIHSWVIVRQEAREGIQGSTLELYALIWSGACAHCLK
jgi:hypothetical protein